MVDLQLVQLTKDLETQFWRVVKQDYCEFYFFKYDWVLQKDRTQISMAIEGDVVVGLMLIYDGCIAQLRGEREAVEFMLHNLSIDSVDVQVPLLQRLAPQKIS
ncbi:MAG: hypothetical protein M1540_00685 [Candidatus Bathyarchaeota archaeon]|nr:hypothetical protein [Candidatus Bathyarchaeota archaeon]